MDRRKNAIGSLRSGYSFEHEYPRKVGFSWVRNEHFFRPKNVKMATFAICSAPVRCYECSLGARAGKRRAHFATAFSWWLVASCSWLVAVSVGSGQELRTLNPRTPPTELR